MNDFVTKLSVTPSFVKFLKTSIKELKEDDYTELQSTCIREIDEERPDFSKLGFSGNMAWFSPRQSAFKKLLEHSGIRIRWNSEFEDRLRDYLKDQGPNPGIGPIGKTEWYSQKRKELEDIMTREDQDVGC